MKTLVVESIFPQFAFLLVKLEFLKVTVLLLLLDKMYIKFCLQGRDLETETIAMCCGLFCFFWDKIWVARLPFPMAVLMVTK